MTDHELTLGDVAKLAGGIPKTTVFSWTLGHNPKIDSVLTLVKNLRADGLEPRIDFQEFLTGEPRLDVKAEAKVEDFFEDGNEALSGIYRVTLTHLVPRGSKLPTKRKI